MKRVFLFSIAVLTAAGVLAQTTMTFDECLREAAGKNPDLYIARENVNLQRTALWKSYTLFIPSLGADLSYSRGNQELETGYETSDRYDAGIGGGYTVFNGFQDSAALNQSRASFSQSELSLRQAKADLVYSVRNAFYQLLKAQDAYNLSQEIFKLRKANAELIKIRYDSGSEDKGNLLVSEADYAQAEQAILEARRDISNAQRKLNTVLGRHESVKIVVTGSWDIVLPPATPDFEDLAEATPAYRLAEIDTHLAREGVRKAWGAFYPSLSLNYNLDAMKDDGSYIPLGKMWTIGASVGISAINLQATDYLNLRESRIQLRQSEAEFANQANITAQNLQSAFIAWQNAVVNHDIQVKKLNAERVRMEINKIKYQNGVTSFKDWNDIQNTFISAETTLLTRQYEAVLAHAAWEKALGNSELP